MGSPSEKVAGKMTLKEATRKVFAEKALRPPFDGDFDTAQRICTEFLKAILPNKTATEMFLDTTDISSAHPNYQRDIAVEKEQIEMIKRVAELFSPGILERVKK